MPELYLPILLGTIRRGNRTGDVARFVLSRGRRFPEVETRIVDPATLPFANLVEREWEMAERPPEIAGFVDEMARADGFLIVTPEYNYGIPGTLKNLLDLVYDEWNRKPFGLLGVGAIAGGQRAVDQLRVIVAGLGAVSVPRPVAIPRVASSFGPDGPTDDIERVNTTIDGLWRDLIWYARALKVARAADAPA
jgi:NAD(P)H-dependent FMN reductase